MNAPLLKISIIAVAVAMMLSACLPKSPASMSPETKAFYESLSDYKSLSPTHYEVVKEEITITHDPHTGSSVMTAPRIFNKKDDYSYRIGVTKVDGSYKKSIIFVFVTAYFSGWSFLDKAHSEGKKLRFQQVDRRVVSCYRRRCRVSEDIAIGLTQDEVKKRILDKPAFVFKVYGKRGSLVVKIPSSYFQAVVDTMESL